MHESVCWTPSWTPIRFSRDSEFVPILQRRKRLVLCGTPNRRASSVFAGAELGTPTSPGRSRCSNFFRSENYYQILLSNFQISTKMWTFVRVFKKLSATQIRKYFGGGILSTTQIWKNLEGIEGTFSTGSARSLALIRLPSIQSTFYKIIYKMKINTCAYNHYYPFRWYPTNENKCRTLKFQPRRVQLGRKNSKPEIHNAFIRGLWKITCSRVSLVPPWLENKAIQMICRHCGNLYSNICFPGRFI